MKPISTWTRVGWITVLIVVTWGMVGAWIFQALFWGRVGMADVQTRTSQLVAPNAINCGSAYPEVEGGIHSLPYQITPLCQVDACVVNAFRKHKSFVATIDWKHNFNSIRREITIGDNRGKVSVLTFWVDGFSENLITAKLRGVLTEETCAIPRIEETSGNYRPEILRCK